MRATANVAAPPSTTAPAEPRISPATPDSVAGYYRGVFKSGKWKLVNEAKDAEGAIVLLAQQNGPPLWVRIHPADGGGSMIELSGAVLSKVDSAGAKPAS